MGDLDGFVQGDWADCYSVGKCWAVDQREYQRANTTAFFQAINGPDVRMVQ